MIELDNHRHDIYPRSTMAAWEGKLPARGEVVVHLQVQLGLVEAPVLDPGDE